MFLSFKPISEKDVSNTYYREQLEAKEDMLARTTAFLVGMQRTLEEKNRLLTDTQNSIFESVSFARIIQTSLQPDVGILKIFFQDADYKVLQQLGISGDTVFIKNTNTGVFFGLLDATGHGIPAAMLSISGLLILNELSQSLSLDNPKALLELLNYRLYNTFNSANHSLAHFEGTVFHYSYQTKRLNYSSANGKVLLISSNGEIHPVPVSKYSIGEKQKLVLENFELEYRKGDKLMLFSDGLIDQFGGPSDRKFMISQLRKILSENHSKPVTELSDLLLNSHRNWKGSNDQTDDISFKLIEF